MSTAFVRSINSVSAGETSELYRVDLNVDVISLTEGVNGYTIAYEAPWGSDWKLLARDAILYYGRPGNGQGIADPIERVVFADLSYL